MADPVKQAKNWLHIRKKRQAFFMKMRRILGGSIIAAVIIGPLVYFSVCAIPTTAPGISVAPPLREAPATPDPDLRIEPARTLPSRAARPEIRVDEELSLDISREKFTPPAPPVRPDELVATTAEKIPEDKLQTLQRVFADREARVQSIKRPVDETFEEILIVDRINIDFGPDVIEDKDSAETVGRNILQNYLQSIEGGGDFAVLRDTVGLDRVEKPGQLISWEAKNNAGKWYVTFRQYHHGLPVFDGNVKLIFTESKRLIAITNNIKTDLPDPSEFRAGRALVSEKTKEIFEWDDDYDTIEFINQGYFKQKPAYKIDVSAHNPLGRWEVYVDGVDASIEGVLTDIRQQDSTDPGNEIVLEDDPIDEATEPDDEVAVEEEPPDEEPVDEEVADDEEPVDEEPTDEDPAEPDEEEPVDEAPPEPDEEVADDEEPTDEEEPVDEEPAEPDEDPAEPEEEPVTPEPIIFDPPLITEEATPDPEMEILEMFFSQVLAKIYPQTPDQEPQIEPMADQYVYIEQSRLLTDDEGYFENPSRRWYSLLLDGPYVTVYDDDADNEEIINENPEEPFLWDEEMANLAAINAFYHVNKINRYFAENHDFDLEKKIPLTVNSELVDAYLNGCGAWFNKTEKTIEMGRGGTESCPEELNYALSSDVIYHEYTHFVVEEITHLPNIYGAESAAMGEGLADYFAATINDDPLWGEVVAPNRTRNLDNNLNYKTDLTGNPHHDGQIFSGALWTLRQEIGAEATDRLVFNTLFQDRLHFETFMYGMIIEDDDNDDFSDGTPHLIEIIESFDKHGIGPGLENFEGLPITPEEWSEILEEEYPEGEEDELMRGYSGAGCNFTSVIFGELYDLDVYNGDCYLYGTNPWDIRHLTVRDNGGCGSMRFYTPSGVTGVNTDITVTGNVNVNNGCDMIVGTDRTLSNVHNTIVRFTGAAGTGGVTARDNSNIIVNGNVNATNRIKIGSASVTRRLNAYSGATIRIRDAGTGGGLTDRSEVFGDLHIQGGSARIGEFANFTTHHGYLRTHGNLVVRTQGADVASVLLHNASSYLLANGIINGFSTSIYSGGTITNNGRLQVYGDVNMLDSDSVIDNSHYFLQGSGHSTNLYNNAHIINSSTETTLHFRPFSPVNLFDSSYIENTGRTSILGSLWMHDDSEVNNESGAILNIGTTSSQRNIDMYNSANINNSGTMNIYGNLSLADSSSINNLYDIYQQSGYQTNLSDNAMIVNSATNASFHFRPYSPVNLSDSSYFENNGRATFFNSLGVAGGASLVNEGILDARNNVSIGGVGSKFSHNEGTTVINANFSIYGGAELEIMNNGTFDITGDLGMQGSVLGPDTLYAYMTNYLDSASIDGGLLMIEYSITNNHGVLNVGNEAGKYLKMTQLTAGVAPTFTNHHSGTVNVYDSIIMGESASTSAKIINNGTFNVSDGGAINNSVQMYSNTSIENESTVAGSAYFDVESTSSNINDGIVYIYDSAEITNTSSSSYYSYFDANRMFIGQEEELEVGGKFTNSNLGELSLTYSGTGAAAALNIFRGEFKHDADARDLTVAGKVEIKGVDLDHGLFTADQSGTIEDNLAVREYATLVLNGTPGNISTLITNNVVLSDEPSAENTILRVTEHGHLNATGSTIAMGTNSYGGGEIENDGEITADQALVFPNSTITNNGLFTALARLWLITNDTAVFDNHGAFEGGALQVGQSNPTSPDPPLQYGGLFNNYAGGTVNLAGHAIYDSEIHAGGEFAHRNNAGEVNIDGNMVIGGGVRWPGTFTHQNMSGKVAIENLIIESRGIYDLSGDPVNNPGLEVKNLLSINGDSDYKGHLEINGSKVYILLGGEAEINAYGHLENKSPGDNTHGGFTSEGLVTVAAGGLLTSSQSPLSSVEFRRGLLTAGTVEIENDADATNNPTSGHAIEVTGGITTIGTPTNTGTTTSNNIYVSGGDFITYNDSSLTGDMTVIGSAASAYFEGNDQLGCHTDILGDFSVLDNGTATINCENTGAVNVRSSSPGGVTTVEGTLIINTNLETEEMYVGDGSGRSGLVTHDEVDETWDPTTTFVLTVSDILHVRSNGAMDVSAKSTIQDNPDEGFARGGSHGGRGQYINSTSDTVYGKIADPLIDFGRQGENGRESGKGGGIMHIDAFNFLIDSPGIVASNGEDAGENAGSGGSINIYTSKLSGTGNIQANGGAATRADWTKTSGGGGRIYIEYYDMAGFTGDISAIGGQNTDGDQAGTGTIYYLWTDKWQNQKHGTLVVDAKLGTDAVHIDLLDDPPDPKDNATQITSSLYVGSVQLKNYGSIYLPDTLANPAECAYNVLTYYQCVESSGGQLYVDSSVCAVYNPEHDQIETGQCVSTPNPPGNLYINNASQTAQEGQLSNKTNLATINTLSPVVSGIHTDPDEEDAIQYQFQIAKSIEGIDGLWDDNPGTCDIDEQPFDNDVSDGTRSEDIAVPSASCVLGFEGTYYWRMRFKDRDAFGNNGWGLWSQSGQFDVDSGGIITVGNCSSGTKAIEITGLLEPDAEEKPKQFDEEECEILVEATDAINIYVKKDQSPTRVGGAETLPDMDARNTALEGETSVGFRLAETGFHLIAQEDPDNEEYYDAVGVWHQLKTDLVGLGSHILLSNAIGLNTSFDFLFGAYVLTDTIAGTYSGAEVTFTLTDNP